MVARARLLLVVLARSLLVLGCATLVLLSVLLLLDVAGPWAQACAATALACLLALPVALRGRDHAAAAPALARGVVRRTPVPGMPEYEVLLAELEKHRRMERELVAARQASEAAMMAKGEFLATMSHEIRTPLNGIIPLLDILLGSRLEPDQREYVGTAYQSARQLLRIVDDILDYSKLEANKLQLETVGINLREMLDSVLRLMDKPAEAKGLRLALRIDPSVRLAVRGDPVRLRQVLTNLLSNAVKFTERGSVTLHVSRRGETGSHHLLRFEVRDTGIGIDPQAASKLFQPFSQADTSTTRTYGGTGLGLVICRRIVDLMEGRIGVESQLGKGALFWFEIPLLKAVGDLGARRHELNGARTLLLTSDARMHRRLALALPNWGVNFVHAGSTQEALSKLRAAAARSETWAFHLLLVDLASARNTAVALHRNVQREAGLESLHVVYLEGDDPAPAELAQSERALFLPREAPEGEMRQRITRFLEGPGSGPAAPLVALGSSVPATAPPAPAPGAERPLAGHVLLVEDNPVNRQVAQRLLSLSGFSIDVAENGREALERLQGRRYDAVLMDCQMPVLDGYSATGQQREREAASGQPRVPIIAMTANAMLGDREKCLEAGMDDYLSKPLNRGLLEETLRRWIRTPSAAPPRRGTVPGAVATPAAAAPRARAGLAPAAAGTSGRGAEAKGAPSAPAAAAAAAASDAHARSPAAKESLASVAGLGEPPAFGSPLRMEIIEDLREIMGAEFNGLVRVFLEDAPVAVQRIEQAAAAGDIDALVPPAHSLKSTSANLGAMRLSELAKALEHGARRGGIADPGGMASALAGEYQRVAEALRAQIG